MTALVRETHAMLRAVSDIFCPRLFPSGELLLLSLAADLSGLRRNRLLATLGLNADYRIRIPNVVLDYAEKGWLILLEIAGCNGVIDSHHRQDLLSSFASVTRRDLVLITVFADMAEFVRLQCEIAWRTSAWIAEVPDHLVVFDGPHLIGPEPAATETGKQSR